MAEEDVLSEVEAVQAVYGDDCQIINAYPPHIHVLLKPRTADVSSQQFVEAIIGIQVGPQYPEVPPEITVIYSKGLDEHRQKHLAASIRNKSFELLSYLMLVALCEEAVEWLTTKNHPDGNCPLCLYPLVDEIDVGSNARPFMKLMSCFHCFHCDCIIRWWNWIQVQSEKEVAEAATASSSASRARHPLGMHKVMEKSMGKCPVCREVFLAKDIEHVLSLVGDATLWDAKEVDNEADFLQSESEKLRRIQFDAVLNIQQENSGLIEPKRDEVLLPGMFLVPSTSKSSAESDTGSSEPQYKDLVDSGINSECYINQPASEKLSNSYRKKGGPQNSRKQVRKWFKKESGSEN